MATVDIVHWNPWRPVFGGRLGRVFPIRARVNNFGDLLGQRIARLMVERAGLKFERSRVSARLLCVGSILSLARPGDIVWGAGINGKSLTANTPVKELDFRSVRGPGTFAWASERGASVPPVFGDPGLLVPFLFNLAQLRRKGQLMDHLIVPNLNDMPGYTKGKLNILDPRSPLDECVATIANARCVVGSSLHALVLADAMGIPSQRVSSDHEPEFKYRDYYEGARIEYREPSPTVSDALKHAVVRKTSWLPHSIIGAFPFELWTTDVKAAVERVLHSFISNV